MSFAVCWYYRPAISNNLRIIVRVMILLLLTCDLLFILTMMHDLHKISLPVPSNPPVYYQLWFTHISLIFRNSFFYFQMNNTPFDWRNCTDVGRVTDLFFPYLQMSSCTPMRVCSRGSLCCYSAWWT
jgi:hypothetical protein